MWLLLAQSALAGSLGQVSPDPEVERISLAVRAETQTVGLHAVGCVGEAGCDAVLEQRARVAELSLALLRGVGIYGAVGHQADTVLAAEYAGEGRSWTVGARAALPLGDAWGVALDAHYQRGGSLGEAQSGALSGPGSQRQAGPTLSLVGTLGTPRDGGVAWLGVQSSPGLRFDLNPLGDIDQVALTEVILKPQLPLSGVFGLSGVSEELGLPWRRTTRLSAGAEAWLGQTSGLGAWMAVGY